MGPPLPYRVLLYWGYDWFNGTDSLEITHLDLEWLEILDYGTASDHKNDHSFFNRFIQACLDSSAVNGSIPNQVGKDLGVTCMASGLAVGITEGLLKVANHFDVNAVGSVDDHEGRHHGPSMTLSPWIDVNIKPAPNGMVQ